LKIHLLYLDPKDQKASLNLNQSLNQRVNPSLRFLKDLRRVNPRVNPRVDQKRALKSKKKLNLLF
jgi:hypothetical protein